MNLLKKKAYNVFYVQNKRLSCYVSVENIYCVPLRYNLMYLSNIFKINTDCYLPSSLGVHQKKSEIRNHVWCAGGIWLASWTKIEMSSFFSFPSAIILSWVWLFDWTKVMAVTGTLSVKDVPIVDVNRKIAWLFLNIFKLKWIKSRDYTIVVGWLPDLTSFQTMLDQSMSNIK